MTTSKLLSSRIDDSDETSEVTLTLIKELSLTDRFARDHYRKLLSAFVAALCRSLAICCDLDGRIPTAGVLRKPPEAVAAAAYERSQLGRLQPPTAPSSRISSFSRRSISTSA
uniref:Uncharacterized protein n=1 Tax=Glossina austeni TaxID=7395 RepID=A0A1A9VFB1_GLOAU